MYLWPGLFTLNNGSMRKIHLLSANLIIAILLPLASFAQRAEWVQQVIVANGNTYEFAPPYIDYVTVQTYDPSSGVTYVFDQIYTQSVQDVVIGNNKIYVAAEDSIIMYDANTLARVGGIADSGLSRLHLFNNMLIVTKQYPIVRFFAEVLNAGDLSLIALIQNLSGDCKGITHTQDSVYIAVNGGYAATEGKLAVINKNNWTLRREIPLGADIAGINDIYNYGGVIYCINETPFGVSDAGSISAYDTYSTNLTTYMLDVSVGNLSGGVKNSGIIGDKLYLSLNNGIGSFNLTTNQIQDTTIFPDPGAAMHIQYTSFTTDYVNSLLYINVGDRSTFGLDLVGTIAGDSVTSFTTGTNADALAIDYRVPVGIDGPTAEKASVVVYPNPAENMVRVNWTGNSMVEEILIRNLTGHTVFQRSESHTSGTWIDCSSFPAGLYFVTLKTDHDLLSTKFVKK